ncbi:MAG TPA: biopolymer transporter ExbD, partial [Pyrinomonadaceae bacterium]
MTKKVTTNFQTQRFPAAAIVMLFLTLATSCAQTPTTTTTPPAPQTQKQAPAPVNTPPPQPAKVMLNGEDLGTTADLSGFKQFLKDVIQRREEQGVVRSGTDEIEKTVFVRAESSLRLGEVIKVFQSAQQAGASPLRLPVEVKTKTDDSRPPMLLLLITIGNPPEAMIGDMSDGIALGDIYEQPADRADKEMLLEPAIRVKIPGDGEYVINGKPVGKSAS